MFNAGKLDIQRQTIVGKAVEDTLAVVRPVPLTDATRTRGEAVVAATEQLRTFTDYKPARVDRPTDTVIAEFDHLLEAHERVLRDDVVALGPQQLEALARARMARARIFPQGTGFIRSSMDLQWSALLAVRERMEEPEVSAAIDGLGMRPAANHLLAHIELYGRMVGVQASKARGGEEKASTAWTEVFQLYAAQVLLDYEKDTALKQELLGAYETQLGLQRAVLRAKKARASAAAEAEEPAPPAPATPAAG